MRVAVVGAGVSGLVAARELHARGIEVTVFEADGARRRPLEHGRRLDAGRRWAVDTGFIVFNDRNYPNFERLLGELGVRDPALRR